VPSFSAVYQIGVRLLMHLNRDRCRGQHLAGDRRYGEPDMSIYDGISGALAPLRGDIVTAASADRSV